MTDRGSVAGQWKIHVDPGRCIGSGLCVGTAPDRFRFDDQQRSQPVDALTGPDDAIMDAAISCPVEAITLSDAATGEDIPLDE